MLPDNKMNNDAEIILVKLRFIYFIISLPLAGQSHNDKLSPVPIYLTPRLVPYSSFRTLVTIDVARLAIDVTTISFFLQRQLPSCRVFI